MENFNTPGGNYLAIIYEILQAIIYLILGGLVRKKDAK